MKLRRIEVHLVNSISCEDFFYFGAKRKKKYFLRSILLVFKMDVSNTKIHLHTSILRRVIWIGRSMTFWKPREICFFYTYLKQFSNNILDFIFVMIRCRQF